MGFLFCLDLSDTLDVVLVVKESSASSQSVHTCLNTDCLQHGAVEIFCWTSYDQNKKVPNSTKLTYLWTIFLEWIFKICTLESSFGSGNSIFLSNLPDLIKAGSSTSGLLVAQMTLISSLGSKLRLRKKIPIQMVQKLEHSSLYFSVAWLIIVKSFCSDSINFINEDDCWGFFFGKGKSVSDHFWTVTDVHLYEVWTGKLKEGSFGLSSTSSGHHSLSCTWGSKHEASLWWPNTDVIELFFVSDWQNDGFSEFFNLLIKSTNIGILLRRPLFNLHGSDSWIIFGREFFQKNVRILIYTDELSWL